MTTPKVYLFTGVETFDWTLQDFDNVIKFCKDHNIDGIIVKIYEYTQGEWYQQLTPDLQHTGADALIVHITSQGLDCLPYGYFYGVHQKEENSYALMYLTKYGKFCMNLEKEWNNNANGAASALAIALKDHPGTLLVSTWADPVQQGWVENIGILDSVVDVWMPEEYSDFLIQARLNEWPKMNRGAIYPTYAVAQETIDLMAITDFPSIWEYQTALQHPDWVDQMVAHMKGTTVAKNWFDYDIVVPFGQAGRDAGFDLALYAPHDIDIGAPANFPVTALLSGTVVSIDSPKWGMQVGIKLSTPYNGVPYMSYLHLSAVNPALKLGSTVMYGDLIGWVGGGTTNDMFANSTNPTGVNFLNDSFNSSRIQVGVALMRGPSYGLIGWQNFPPIDTSLDPTQIILDARKGLLAVDFSAKQFRDVWLGNPNNIRPDTGIYNALLSVHRQLNIGIPAQNEVDTVDWGDNPIMYQDFSSNYHVEYSKVDGKTRIYDQFNKLVMTI